MMGCAFALTSGEIFRIEGDIRAFERPVCHRPGGRPVGLGPIDPLPERLRGRRHHYYFTPGFVVAMSLLVRHALVRPLRSDRAGALVEAHGLCRPDLVTGSICITCSRVI